MQRYVCAKKKEEILEVVVNKFNYVNQQYEKETNVAEKHKLEQQYWILLDLLRELEIYEK